MSIELFSLYRNAIFQLAKTLVIKYSMAADAMNNGLIELNYNVDLNSPHTWRYYKNIAGQYHSSDILMQVTSIDTLETIDFTSTNLSIHRATAHEYRYGTDYYNALVAKYPEQETLILGILNPVDIDVAIDAADGTILYYDRTLVEPQETNLIPNLESWIKRFMRRWVNKDYANTNDLYPASVLGVLSAQLVPVIQNQRKANCHTAQVHSYHIGEYLASHGGLDVYLDVMTLKQALFLYRNISYIEANAGKQSTFDTLVQKLLTERAYPLTQYDLVHNTFAQPDQLLPDVEMLQKDINQKRAFGYTSRYSVGEILVKEEPFARDNTYNLDEKEVEIVDHVNMSAYNNYGTKVLESSIIDSSDLAIRTFGDVLLNEWLYMATQGKYAAVIPVIHPISGVKFTLSPKDAFVLFTYAFAKARGIALTDIPSFQAQCVRKPRIPTVDYVRGHIPKRYLNTTDTIAVLSNQPVLSTYVSIENFYIACQSIHDRMQLHFLQYSGQSNFARRSAIKSVALASYMDIECTLYANRTYSNWFTDTAWNRDGMLPSDWDALATAIVRVATGASLATVKTVKEIHAGMIALMTQLSSYTVQIIPTVNTSAITNVDMPEATLGEVITGISAALQSPCPRAGVRIASGHVFASGKVDDTQHHLAIRQSGHVYQSARVNVTALSVAGVGIDGNHFVPIARAGVASATLVPTP